MRFIAALLCLLLSVTACASKGPSNQAGSARPVVVAAFYPIYEAVRRVGGSAVDVVNLTAAGAEPHDLELTSKQVDTIEDADAVVYVGHGFQPALEDALKRTEGIKVDLLAGRKRDTHIWLSPTLWKAAIARVAQTLARVDARHAAGYRTRADAYDKDVSKLDAAYRSGLKHCARSTIVTNHAAFGYLAADYGLTQIAISGLAPEAEPSPQRIADLTDLVRRKHVTTIFTESLVSPKVARTLASEAGVKTRILDPIEGLSAAQLALGRSYLTQMRRNLEAIRTALSCR